MKLVVAKCPSCGADIDVDANSDTTKCEFCHSKIIVEDAIKKLRLEIKGEVEIKNLPKISNYLKNGARYYENDEYDEAYRQYNKAVELDPDNYVAVLRSGICNSLKADVFGINLNHLKSGIKEANGILESSEKLVDDDKYNQVANEGFIATKKIESIINNINGNELSDYKNTVENIKKLLDCMCIYFELSEVAKDVELKKKTLKAEIDLSNSIITKKKYKTGRYANGREIIGTFILPSNLESLLFKLKKEAVDKYNNLVDPSHQIYFRRKRSMSIEGKVIIAFSLLFVFFFIFIIIFTEDKNFGVYDYVQNCNGLETVSFIDIYSGFDKNEEETENRYLNKQFIFEGKILKISKKYEKTYVQFDLNGISPKVYLNDAEIQKLSNYNIGDNIRVCGTVTRLHSFEDDVRVENGSIVNN